MVRLLVISLILMLSACSKPKPDSAEQYIQAVEAFAQENYVESAKLLQPLLKSGHHDAQFLIADMHMTGKLGEPNSEAGLKWLSEAANNGHVRAQSMMGVRYLNGNGVDMNEEKAVELLQSAANSKNAKAQLLMGFLHGHGKGVEKSDDIASRYYYAAILNGEEEAIDRLKKIAETGNAEASTYLGLMHKDGVGVQLNAIKAAELVLSGAEQGFPLAQYMISHAYGSGQGFEQDYLKAHMWANLAAANEHEDADKRRDVWAQLMTPEQIAQAQKMASDWTANFEAAQE